MPQSKNKRKNKSAQTRKVNQTKAESQEKINSSKFSEPSSVLENPRNSFGEPSSVLENPRNSFGEQSPIPVNPSQGIRTYGFSPGWKSEPEYKIETSWNGEDLDDLQHVHFEMTEAHFWATEISKVDFMAEIEGGDIMGPDVASVDIDPRDKIIGHPRWETGKDAIRELDTDPSVFRGEFDGNRWQGKGSTWADCPPERKDCWDRQGITSCGNSPVCSQCQEETKPEETHYHILEHEKPGRMCQKCWNKGPLPLENRVEGIKFTET